MHDEVCSVCRQRLPRRGAMVVYGVKVDDLFRFESMDLRRAERLGLAGGAAVCGLPCAISAYANGLTASVGVEPVFEFKEVA